MWRVPGGEQLALVDEVRGEEDDQQHLGRFAGLEVHRTDAHPEPGPVDLLPEPGERRQQQRGDAEQQERVLVPLERADVAHDHEGQHERGDADRGPHRLHAREVAVEARDGEVPDPVEQEHDRQQRRDRSAARSGGPRSARRRRARAPRAGTPRGRRGCRGGRRAAAARSRRRSPRPRAARGRARGCAAGGRWATSRCGRRERGRGAAGAWWSAEPSWWCSWWWSSSSWSASSAGATNARRVGARRERLVVAHLCLRGRLQVGHRDGRCAARWSGSQPARPPGTPLNTVTCPWLVPT